MPLLGICRVTDITRLDRLGVPVFATVRPRGRTLRVHAGKGIQALEARVGALMEAIEFAVAERASAGAPEAHAAIGDLLAQFGGELQWLDFAPRAGVPVDPTVPIAAARCENIASGRHVLLPAPLVMIAQPVAQPSPHFGWTTNGLASGNSLEEATLHALFEVLERDTLAMNRARDDSEPIDTSTLPAPFAEWAERWRQMGVELLLHRVPNEFGLPCFKAVLHEPSSPDVNLAAGYGLHVEREIALARTLCEAAQSRLSFIHGGRDDIAPFYAKLEAGAEAVAAAQSRFLATWRARGDSVAFEATPQPALRHHGTRSMLDDVLRLMHSRGFDTVLRRRFEIEGGVLESHGLFLVKVVVPRCENVSNDTRRMGMRLLTRVVGEHA